MADKDTTSMNLYQKLAAITGEIGSIAKDGKNSEQNFLFIEYAAVAGKLRTLFAKYGVVVVPRMQRADKQHRSVITSKYGKEGSAVLVDMYFTIVNADAPTDKFTVTWTGEAADFGDKATNKAATSALKYYLMRQFNISEKGEDPDAASPASERPTATVAAPRPAQAKQLPAVNPDKIKAELADLMDELHVSEPEAAADFYQEAIGKKAPVNLSDAVKAIEYAKIALADIKDAMNLPGASE